MNGNVGEAHPRGIAVRLHELKKESEKKGAEKRKELHLETSGEGGRENNFTYDAFQGLIGTDLNGKMSDTMERTKVKTK